MYSKYEDRWQTTSEGIEHAVYDILSMWRGKRRRCSRSELRSQLEGDCSVNSVNWIILHSLGMCVVVV